MENSYFSTARGSQQVNMPEFDEGRLNRIYDTLRDSGLSEADILAVIRRMGSDSSLDPFRDDGAGEGLVEGSGYHINMFSDDADGLDDELGRQLAYVAGKVKRGEIPYDAYAGVDDERLKEKLGVNSFSDGGDIDDWYDEASGNFGWYPSRGILEYIKKAEGFRPYWYKDGSGVDTIGYGFTDKELKESNPRWMSRKDADRRFRVEIDGRIKSFIAATPNFDRLTSDQKDALFDYYYNVGHGNYTTGSPVMQAALASGDLYAVRDSIDIGYNDRRNPGLRKRRDYERSLFRLAPRIAGNPAYKAKPVIYPRVLDDGSVKWASKQRMTGRKYGNVFAPGGSTDEEYYSVNPDAAVVSAALPGIGTAEGKRIAGKIAADVISGSRDMDSVPWRYRSYVEGEVKGAEPVRRAINKAAPVVGLGLAGAAAAPYVIGAVPGSGLGAGVSHLLRVVGNPALAKTKAGAAASTLLDSIGLVEGVRGLSDDVTDIAHGNISLSDIPKIALDASVMVPGSSQLVKPDNITVLKGQINGIKQGINNLKQYKAVVSDRNFYLPGLQYAQDKYSKRASTLLSNDKKYASASKNQQIDIEPVDFFEGTASRLDKLPDIKIENFFGKSNRLSLYNKLNLTDELPYDGLYDNGKIIISPYNITRLKEAYYNPNSALSNVRGVSVHEGTHWALDKLGVTPIRVKGGEYYLPNKKHPLYDSVLKAFETDRPGITYWEKSPEELAAEMTRVQYLLDMPASMSPRYYGYSDENTLLDYLTSRFAFGKTIGKNGVRDIVYRLSDYGFSTGGKIGNK